MDPITALGLAASIVPFVDFSSRILSDVVEIYHNGSKLEMRELETINKDLLDISTGIKSEMAQVRSSGSTLSAADQALYSLSEQVSAVASELLKALNSLKVDEKYGRAGSI
jgi:hypothetical protein